MLKTIVTILFILLACPLPLWATDWFVRPAGGNYGAENGSSYNNAWDGWSDITWASMSAGDTLYICGELQSLCSIKKDGTPGNYFIVRGDYPGDPGSVTSKNSSGLLIRCCSYIKVMNLTINNCGSNGLVFDLYGGSSDESNVIIDNVTSYGNTRSGIRIDSCNQIAYKISDVTIQNCTTYNNGRFGYFIHGYVKDVILQNCISHHDSQTGPDWGYLFSGVSTRPPSGGNSWTVHTGNIYVIDASDNIDDVVTSDLSHGFLSEKTGGVVNLDTGEYYHDTENNKLYVHLGGTNPNAIRMYIIHKYIQNVNAYDCIAHNTKNPTGGEGHGMGFEVGTKNCGFYRCQSYDNGDSNGGNGFIAMADRDCTVAYCTARGNHGAGFSAQTNQSLKHYNNVAYNNRTHGFYYFHNTNVTVNNCIAYSNSEHGIKKAANVIMTNDYNCSYGNSTNFHGVSKGTHSLESDPLFIDLSNNNFMFQSTSLCKDAGVNIPGLHPTIDIRSRTTPHNGYPDIGANEFLRLSKPRDLRIGSN